jgi:hypothetical protein
LPSGPGRTIPHRLRRTTALASDGHRHTVYYWIGEETGFIGANSRHRSAAQSEPAPNSRCSTVRKRHVQVQNPKRFSSPCMLERIRLTFIRYPTRKIQLKVHRIGAQYLCDCNARYGATMSRQVADSDNVLRFVRPKSTTSHYMAWQLWHVWTVTIPRRSITGKLVWGTVLRRLVDGRWIYKKYVEDWDLD